MRKYSCSKCTSGKILIYPTSNPLLSSTHSTLYAYERKKSYFAFIHAKFLQKLSKSSKDVSNLLVFFIFFLKIIPQIDK